jgi:PST family polysaccharide transporter
MLLAIVVGAWVARYLGPGQFGELAYVLAFVAFFQALSLLGLDGLTVRDIARDSVKRNGARDRVSSAACCASVGWLKRAA